MLALSSLSTAFGSQPLPVVNARAAVRVSGPPVMAAEGQSSRRAALLGLATLAVPAVANAAPGATPIWKVGSIKTDLGPQASAKKCIAKWEKDKPCSDGAGIKWDAKALGVKKAETRKFNKKA